ncbi:HDOD domain-containing protein [Lentisphaerota bacterium WC36G]|nr:HDOD domain-containing protein [Lentisphaerae bacterium WC36]
MERRRKFTIKQLTYSQALPKIPEKNMVLFRNMIQRRSTLEELAEEILKHEDLMLVLATLAKEEGINALRKSNITKDVLANVLHSFGELNYRHIILSYCVLPLFDGYQKEWEHCYSTSLLLTKLLKRENIFERHNLILLALIHDLGIVILKKFNPLKAHLVTEYKEHFNCSIDEAEVKVFSVDHGTIGGVVMRYWGLDADSVVPVIYHHASTVSNKKLAVETFLIQYINYIDLLVREDKNLMPYSELLQKISRLSFEDKYYIKYQKELLETLEFQKNLYKHKEDDFYARNLAMFRLPIRQDKVSRALAEVSTMTISKEQLPPVHFEEEDGSLFDSTSTISFIPDQKRKSDFEQTTNTSILNVAPDLAPFIKNKKERVVVEDETQVFKRPKNVKRRFFKD